MDWTMVFLVGTLVVLAIVHLRDRRARQAREALARLERLRTVPRKEQLDPDGRVPFDDGSICSHDWVDEA
jgi:hypothetical protein